jgi:hypothetical protein
MFPVDVKVNLGSTNAAEGVNSMFVPLREKIDRTGLELRKSIRCKALRNSSAEGIVTKRVALGERKCSRDIGGVTTGILKWRGGKGGGQV